MRALTIKAKSNESALALCNSLSAFHPEIEGDDASGYAVTVPLSESNEDVIALLTALQDHVSRHQYPASVQLDGRHYTLKPAVS